MLSYDDRARLPPPSPRTRTFIFEYYEIPPHGPTLKKIISHCKLVEYKRGDIVSEAGAKDPAILIVSSGVLCMQRRDPATGKDILYAPVFRGGAVNVIGALTDHSNLTIRSLSRSNVYRLEREAIDRLKSSPQFVEWCTAQIAHNMESLFQYVLAIRSSSVDERVMQIFRAAYWETHRKMPEGRFQMAWPITQNDLAALAGISRPYLNSSLRRLEKAGKARFSGEQAYICP